MLAPALWMAYLAFPMRGWGLLGGIPLGPVGVVAVAAVWLAYSSARIGTPIVPLALILLKAGIGSLALVDRGLTADYYANDALTPPIERSTEYSNTTFTRVDSVLDFGPAADRDLPLFFLNDVARFNYYQPTEPNRAELAYSASWSGNLFVPHEATAMVLIRGTGLRGEIAIDGHVVATLAPDSSEGRGTVSLARGWRRLRVTAAGAYGAQRRFHAGLIDASGRARPFSGEEVFVHRPAEWRIAIDWIVRQASNGVDVLVLVWVGIGACRAVATKVVASPARAAAACVTIAALADAMHFSCASANRLVLLPGGDDPLTYETYARDVLLNGPLMTFGRPLGQGEAYYYQPLYPYVVAGLHRVFGEDFFGVFFVQRLLVALSVALVWRMTRAMFGERIGVAGLGLAAVVLYGRAGDWAKTLMGEIVFIPLVCLWACQLIAFDDDRDRWGAWRAGFVGGLATLARSTLLLAWPFVAVPLAIARKRAGQPRSAIVTMMVAGLAVLSLATARNWIVARTFVPVTTSFGVNFYLGNQPPPELQVPLHPEADHPVHRWIARDERTQMALEFARHAPAAFARNLLNKALYTLGFFGAFVPGARTASALVALWIAALAGVLIVWAVGVETGRPGWPRTIPAIIAISHFASVVIIFPHHDRLILPFYVLLIPYAAAATAAIHKLRD